VKRAWFAPWRRPRTGGDRELVCREVVELVTAYLDDALEPGPRAALERHLSGCPHCTEYFAQIRLVRQTAGRVEPEDLTNDARRDLMALFQQWQADPESASEPRPEGTGPADS
jgi:anti-sigma factor RsiW